MKHVREQVQRGGQLAAFAGRCLLRQESKPVRGEKIIYLNYKPLNVRTKDKFSKAH